MRSKGQAAAELNLELEMRKKYQTDSMGMEDDFLAGFGAGAAYADGQRAHFIECIEGLIKLAAANNEFHALAYGRYILRRMG
jgi:hypothetical protein